GPVDPSAVNCALQTARELIGTVPLMGICLGHQILALAAGAETGRLAFGHHGCNHPVKSLLDGTVAITSQNHNFAVQPESLPSTLELTHVNLNDGTVEGIRHRTEPVFSVQYHPEAAPGPHDSKNLFQQFRQMF
ncbi:MAG: gamma-glutamyl-gamma-aminobutyrate hydrolase family protein, partial [Planctomycetia bacterium]|nr:gamma-glutamyl-gamma-aminobutyrate hydrolase family protein [Planctomycetia bacterium]